MLGPRPHGFQGEPDLGMEESHRASRKFSAFGVDEGALREVG